MIFIREARYADGPQLKQLLDEMARQERLPVLISEERLTADAFGPSPRIRILVAEADRELAGYALFYDCYSSFQGVGLFLEDLFVREAHRGHHVGRMLLARVAEAATMNACFGIVFNVLDWNTSAFDFFTRAGATVLHERKTLHLGAKALRNLQMCQRSNT